MLKEERKRTKAMNLLDKINSPKDLKKLNLDEANVLCEEIRKFLVEKVSKSGGHLASNLGAVELTVALHRSLDMDKDKIVWDVGHQSYVHKILTGRKGGFDKLRDADGISGFPKTEESETDSFNTGHSSTSVSAAIGLAVANKLQNKDGYVVAVIGDGAMTGGMAYEALNHAGGLQIPMIIILNDNGIAISPSVGLLSAQFNKMRKSPLYFSFKRNLKKIVRKIPLIGKPIEKYFAYVKNALKRVFVRDGMFESLGVKYMGPADGHNIEELELLINEAKKSKELTVIHIQTKKGKGYAPAEERPDIFHGVPTFNPESGEVIESTDKTFSDIFSDVLVELAEKNDKIVGITAAMPDGTGMKKFSEKFPDRFFDVGIAEEHAVTFSAGLAKNGIIPIFAVYSTFLQRGYDQLIHDVALQNLHCIFAVDRAGIVGKDGETHQGVFDLSYFSHIPNFTVMAPSDGEELRKMLEFAVNECEGPIAIRYPRGKASGEQSSEPIEKGIGRVLKDGSDAVLIAIGLSVKDSLEASRILESKGIRCGVIDARFLKPLDEKLIIEYINKCKVVGTVEENVNIGGLYTAVKSVTNREVLCFALPCEAIKHGKVEQIKEKYGIDGKSIADRIIKKFGEQVL